MIENYEIGEDCNKFNAKLMNEEYRHLCKDTKDYEAKGKYSEAIRIYELFCEKWEEILNSNEQHLDSIMNHLASLYYKNRNFIEAISYYTRLLDLREKKFGNDHIETADTYNNLGINYSYINEDNLAGELLGKALEIREKAFGERHVEIASSYYALSLYYLKLDLTKAIKYGIESVSIREELLGINNFETSSSLNRLGIAYFFEGSYTLAGKCYGKCLEIRKKLLGENHPETARIYRNLAVNYERQGDIKRTLKYFKRSYLIYQSTIGTNDYTLKVCENIFGIYNRQNNFYKSCLYFHNALRINEILNDNKNRGRTSYFISTIKKEFNNKI
jgi:tetratricopeptide (TPR) repeat protein